MSEGLNPSAGTDVNNVRSCFQPALESRSPSNFSTSVCGQIPAHVERMRVWRGGNSVSSLLNNLNVTGQDAKPLFCFITHLNADCFVV